MAYDADGTILLSRNVYNGDQWTERGQTNRTELNDEDNTTAFTISVSPGSPSRQLQMVWIFPELREFDGFFGAQGSTGVKGSQTPGSPSAGIYTSGTVTNGYDGDPWSSQVAAYSVPTDQPYPTQYRTSITSIAASNARGVRWVFASQDNEGWRTQVAAHLYGEISPGETPDRLLFIDEGTGLEFTLPEDWGDVPRGSSEDRTWRIKNNSSTLTANTVQYTVEALYLGSASWYTHTLPGGASYQATQQIASIAPSTTTGLITTRRVTPGGEALGLHAARAYLNTASWS